MLAARAAEQITSKEGLWAQYFQSLGRTVTAGVALLIVLVAIVVGVTGTPVRVDHAWMTFFMRWLHVLSGVMWIGLLWYFNFVQIPSMPKIPDEQKPAIGKVIAPTALFWFRWAALATVVTGALLAWMMRLSGPRADAASRPSSRLASACGWH